MGFKDYKDVYIRIGASLSFGIFVIMLLMAISIIISKGSGYILVVFAGYTGLFIYPFVISISLYLYEFKRCRWVINAGGILGSIGILYLAVVFFIVLLDNFSR